MYIHEISHHRQFTAIAHYRETTSGGGLAVLTELGHTVAQKSEVSKEERDRLDRLGLAIPSMAETIFYDTSRTETDSNPAILESQAQERCETLEDFIRLGIERWKKLLPSLGKVAGIEARLVEIHEDTGATISPSGLLIAGERTDVVFKDYVATPDEIEAIQRIAQSVPIESDTSSYTDSTYL